MRRDVLTWSFARRDDPEVAAGPDFNQIMGLIQEAHELTVRLSGLLAPVRIIKRLLVAGS